MISVVVREYCASDYTDVLEIDNEAFSPKNPAYDLYIYLTYGSDMLVADIGGKIVGYVALMEVGLEAKIMSIAVKKAFRNMGIGGKLLDEAIKKCKERGKIRLFLEVRVSNYVAQHLYKKKGFEIVDIIPNYYNDGEDAYVMALNLAGQ
ncbi:ribosomal protein S18-alanine N-acetyltransferase [Archaeoglobus veneficus]|uniref:Ribosomal-protein-alanine acetyltransferase n=1 Tax=Archaeoglobus veneficus (strain DSM 11195 / SNP6) TaxID=693661 RepID=F2KRT6_ARCVS|nr:ribosomal protein S18-alanine N-acetyltransferase [Archaeoglobus veneficus]AEA47950.1 ribosomal-protein-alanine acetyltransferase [Archaeoglobus veneficus SNP6]